MSFYDLTLDQALDRLNQSPVKLLAGGTDYYPSLQETPPSSEVLDITRIESLQGIHVSDQEGWRIGAGVTWTQLIKEPLPPAFRALKLAAREVGSVQIQNKGTLVGNLCNASPAADGVPALLALDAEVEIARKKGTRTVPLSEFITGVRSIDLAENELVSAILIPPVKPATGLSLGASPQSHFVKLGARSYLVISIAMVAVQLSVNTGGIIECAAIAVGACSPVAQRMDELEALLVGQPCPENFAGWVKPDALKRLSAIDDVRGTAAYRLDVVARLIEQSLTETASLCVNHPSEVTSL
ncbi:MAG: FAD binding domain-containing protein [Gammaproteobacteria bacterium]|nr:FAD binding domain-containing protein [Gammaproteobacteria bacterium]